MINADQIKVGLIFQFVNEQEKTWGVYEVVEVNGSGTKIIPLYCSQKINYVSFYYRIINNPFMDIIDQNKLQYYRKLSVFQ